MTALVIALGVVPVAIAKTPKPDLVLVGKVFTISQRGTLLKPWTVTIDVEKVISGKFDGGYFSFLIHSPARLHLEQGHSYTIRAFRLGDGYEVNEATCCTPNRAASSPGTR